MPPNSTPTFTAWEVVLGVRENKKKIMDTNEFLSRMNKYTTDLENMVKGAAEPDQTMSYAKFDSVMYRNMDAVSELLCQNCCC